MAATLRACRFFGLCTVVFDQALFLLLNLDAGAPSALVAAARFAGHDLMAYVVVATVAVAGAGRAPWRAAAGRALLAMALASLLAHVLKQQFGAARPFALGLGTQWLAHGGSPGFPSSHAAAVAAWAAVGAAASRRWPQCFLFCAVAAAVGYGRVALGLHFPRDVVAGWLLGVPCAVAVHVVVQQLAHAARTGRILAAWRVPGARRDARARHPR